MPTAALPPSAPSSSVSLASTPAARHWAHPLHQNSRLHQQDPLAAAPAVLSSPAAAPATLTLHQICHPPLHQQPVAVRPLHRRSARLMSVPAAPTPCAIPDPLPLARAYRSHPPPSRGFATLPPLFEHLQMRRCHRPSASTTSPALSTSPLSASSLEVASPDLSCALYAPPPVRCRCRSVAARTRLAAASPIRASAAAPALPLLRLIPVASVIVSI
ncbi:hypothetical protein Syun_010419 [Stephania yunnanensis]|uniref:Uncharacterized protein n=1 Tax=Stephania yunnanensis TaxID=152371 RepID=A0AAP0PRR6_9MAGN